MPAALVIVTGILVITIAYGWTQAGWLRERVLEVPLDGLPEALDGVRIAHLSDFHLGAPLSRGNRASERAARWVAERRPDIVCITGDLVSHPRGEPRLRALLAALDHPFVVLGNDDVAVTRDPFSRAAELRDLERARLLGDEAEPVELGGELVCVVGVDPETYRAKRARPDELGDPGQHFASCCAISHVSSSGFRARRSISSSPATCMPARSAYLFRVEGSRSRIHAPSSCRGSTGRMQGPCTCHRAQERRSSRSGSSPGPK